MYATLDSTPGVISQIFLCTNAPSGFQRRPLRCKALYLCTIDVPPGLYLPGVLRYCPRVLGQRELDRSPGWSHTPAKALIKRQACAVDGILTPSEISCLSAGCRCKYLVVFLPHPRSIRPSQVPNSSVTLRRPILSREGAACLIATDEE